MEYAFYTTDVFTQVIFSGAQIAVIPDAASLDTAVMQRLAGEFNLSETVFVLPPSAPDCDYRLRIFTPIKETGFAGHALIAAAFVLAKSGRLRIDAERCACRLELQDGPVIVNIDSKNNEPVFVQFATVMLPHIDEYVPDYSELADVLSLQASDLGCMKYRVLLSISGSNYLVVPVKNFSCVRNALFDTKAWNRSSAPAMMAEKLLLFTNKAEDRQADFHARLLGPDIGVNEDPPVGAAIPAFSAYLCAHAHIMPGTHAYVVERGLKTTRHSLLSVEMDNKRAETLSLRVGGPAVIVSSGTVNI